MAAPPPPSPSGAASVCTSCGRDDEPVRPVRRVYVTPEAWDTPGRAEVVDEVEHWCFVCRTHYPHEEVGHDESGTVDP